MTRYVSLQRSIHNKAGYTPSIDMGYASKMTTVPLVREELSQVTQHMSIVFQKHSNGNQPDTFDLVGLQALKPNENLFVLPNRRWLGGYKPSFYRGKPFSLEFDKEHSQLQLCIEESAIKTEITEGDIPFFKDDSNLSPMMTRMTEFLNQTFHARAQTLKLVAELASENLIIPWEIPYKEGSEDKILDGFYHIDTKTLMNLPAESVAKLNNSGALEIVYAQRLSEARVSNLTTLQETYKKLLEQQSKVNLEPDLDEVFGKKDELFTF
ncbi:SapC family protein [Marinomonas sp. 2405UD68-3]|uniref:SapC family protein n=1 Tax=Marinomonas sp. 2405UD68-3 TaxID=3391835 RepID=UPI0039C920BB